MLTFLKTYWLLVIVGLALLAGAAWLLSRPLPPPPLSPEAAAAVKDGINHNLASAGRNTTKAKAAAASAATSYQAGKAYADLGTVLHQQSKPHAKPTPSGDTAARRLQRVLAAY